MIQYFGEACVRDRVCVRSRNEQSLWERRGELEYGVSYGEWHKHLDKGDSLSRLKADSGVIGRLCMWGAGKKDLQYIQGSFMTSSVRDKWTRETLFPSLLDTYWWGCVTWEMCLTQCVLDSPLTPACQDCKWEFKNWGGRREEGSGWGTHVYLWWIHGDIWQNQYNIVKLKNKIK